MARDKHTVFNKIWKLECEGWEYLYVSDRCNNKVPAVSGVYLFILQDIYGYCRIMYVGKSTNFSSRLKFPHTMETKWDQNFMCFIQKTTNQDALEIEFIKRYRPELNRQHNG